MSKSTASHHFRVLREAGVITQEVRGRERIITLRRAEGHVRIPLAQGRGRVGSRLRTDGSGEREALLAGGWGKIRSEPGAGTIVEFWVPLPK